MSILITWLSSFKFDIFACLSCLLSQLFFDSLQSLLLFFFLFFLSQINEKCLFSLRDHEIFLINLSSIQRLQFNFLFNHHVSFLMDPSFKILDYAPFFPFSSFNHLLSDLDLAACSFPLLLYDFASFRFLLFSDNFCLEVLWILH